MSLTSPSGLGCASSAAGSASSQFAAADSALRLRAAKAATAAAAAASRIEMAVLPCASHGAAAGPGPAFARTCARPRRPWGPRCPATPVRRARPAAPPRTGPRTRRGWRLPWRRRRTASPERRPASQLPPPGARAARSGWPPRWRHCRLYWCATCKPPGCTYGSTLPVKCQLNHLRRRGGGRPRRDRPPWQRAAARSARR